MGVSDWIVSSAIGEYGMMYPVSGIFLIDTGMLNLLMCENWVNSGGEMNSGMWMMKSSGFSSGIELGGVYIIRI